MYRRGVEAKDVVRSQAQLSKLKLTRGCNQGERPYGKRFHSGVSQLLQPVPVGFVDRFSLSPSLSLSQTGTGEELYDSKISETTLFTARRRVNKSIENSPPLIASAVRKAAEVWHFLPIPARVAVGLSLITLLRGAEIQKVNIGEVIYDARAAVTRTLESMDLNPPPAPLGVRVVEAAFSNQPPAPAQFRSPDLEERRRVYLPLVGNRGITVEEVKCDGCLDPWQTCRPGNEDQYCGKDGVRCDPCPEGTTCKDGVCTELTSPPRATQKSLQGSRF